MVAMILKKLYTLFLSKTMIFWAAEYLANKSKFHFDNELVDLAKAIDSGDQERAIKEAQELIKALEHDYAAMKKS